MEYNILPPTNDWVFKLLFGDERNKNILTSLLKSFVKLPEEEYEMTFPDTHLKPEAEDDKLGIVDVKVKTKTGKIINHTPSAERSGYGCFGKVFVSGYLRTLRIQSTLKYRSTRSITSGTGSLFTNPS